MRKLIIAILVLLLFVSCAKTKETTTIESKNSNTNNNESFDNKDLQQIFDEYIESGNYDGIQALKGKFFVYEKTRIDNTSLDSYPIFQENNYNDENNYRDASVSIYTNNKKRNLSIIYTKFSVRPKKKPKDYKGADTQINEIVLLQCEPGYRFIPYAACKYNDKGEMVLAGSVMCLRKAKILEDGSTEDITVWNEKKIPEYVVEIKSPEEFVITKGENSEYFYYYDENHY